MKKGLNLFASREATIVFFVLLALGALAKLYLRGGETWVLPPLALISLSLCACLYKNWRIFWRKRRGHLLFHSSLLFLLLLFLAGRLVYFQGYLEVSEGQGFSGPFSQASQGPLHRTIFKDDTVVVQEQMEVTYAKGEEGEEIQSGLRFLDGAEGEQSGLVGFNRPMLYRGYRFSVPGRMGYSLLVSFRPKRPGPLGGGNLASEGGSSSATAPPALGSPPLEGAVPTPEHLGFVNMPPYPSERKAQINSFQLPGTGDWVVLLLKLLGEPYREVDRWRFTRPQDYRVIVSFRRQDFHLRQGERCDLGVGTLEVKELRRWMGYGVFYDPTLPYLLMTSALVVVGLLWMFLPLLKGTEIGEERIARAQETSVFPCDVSKNEASLPLTIQSKPWP